jgi:hypothetical protein
MEMPLPEVDLPALGRDLDLLSCLYVDQESLHKPAIDVLDLQRSNNISISRMRYKRRKNNLQDSTHESKTSFGQTGRTSGRDNEDFPFFSH